MTEQKWTKANLRHPDSSGERATSAPSHPSRSACSGDVPRSRNKALSDDVVIRTGAPPSGVVVMRKIRASSRHRRHPGRLVWPWWELPRSSFLACTNLWVSLACSADLVTLAGAGSLRCFERPRGRFFGLARVVACWDRPPRRTRWADNSACLFCLICTFLVDSSDFASVLRETHWFVFRSGDTGTLSIV